MRLRQKLMVFLHLLEEGFELGAEEFNSSTTGRTDDVVVLKAVGLVSLRTVSVVHGLRQAALFKQLEGTMTVAKPV